MWFCVGRERERENNRKGTKKEGIPGRRMEGKNEKRDDGIRREAVQWQRRRKRDRKGAKKE